MECEGGRREARASISNRLGSCRLRDAGLGKGADLMGETETNNSPRKEPTVVAENSGCRLWEWSTLKNPWAVNPLLTESLIGLPCRTLCPSEGA